MPASKENLSDIAASLAVGVHIQRDLRSFGMRAPIGWWTQGVGAEKSGYGEMLSVVEFARQEEPNGCVFLRENAGAALSFAVSAFNVEAHVIARHDGSILWGLLGDAVPSWHLLVAGRFGMSHAINTANLKTVPADIVHRAELILDVSQKLVLRDLIPDRNQKAFPGYERMKFVERLLHGKPDAQVDDDDVDRLALALSRRGLLESHVVPKRLCRSQLFDLLDRLPAVRHF